MMSISYQIIMISTMLFIVALFSTTYSLGICLLGDETWEEED